MDNNDTNTDLLLQYLDNELDDSAKAAVENRLVRDQDLRDKLTTIQLARDAVKLYGLKKQVKQIGAEYRTTTGTIAIAKGGRIRSIGRWSVGVAAVLLLPIAGIGVYEYAT